MSHFLYNTHDEVHGRRERRGLLRGSFVILKHENTHRQQLTPHVIYTRVTTVQLQEERERKDFSGSSAPRHRQKKRQIWRRRCSPCRR